jgi:hypothetical protein
MKRVYNEEQRIRHKKLVSKLREIGLSEGRQDLRDLADNLDETLQLYQESGE